MIAWSTAVPLIDVTRPRSDRSAAPQAVDHCSRPADSGPGTGISWSDDMAHSSLRHHRKLERVMRALSIGRAQAVGHLDLLWMTVQDQRGPDEDGVLRGWTPEDIAVAADWVGDANTFVDALQARSGFLDFSDDGVYSIHDYIPWMPKHIKERIRKRYEYLATSRKSPGSLPEVSRKNAETSAQNAETSYPHVHVHVHEPKDTPLPPNGESVCAEVADATNGELRRAIVETWKITDNADTARRIDRLVGKYARAGANHLEIPVRWNRAKLIWSKPAMATPEAVAKRWGELCDDSPYRPPQKKAKDA
jgi:hypothetical protein